MISVISKYLQCFCCCSKQNADEVAKRTAKSVEKTATKVLSSIIKEDLLPINRQVQQLPDEFQQNLQQKMRELNELGRELDQAVESVMADRLKALSAASIAKD